MLPEPQKAAIMIKMNKIEELEIGMNVMIIKDGEYQELNVSHMIFQKLIVFCNYGMHK